MALPVWGVAEEFTETLLVPSNAANGVYSDGSQISELDYFTGSDSSNLGIDWIQNFGFGISSNAARANNDGMAIAWKKLAATVDADNYAYVQLVRDQVYAGPICRGNGSTTSITGYWLYQDAPGSWVVGKWISGSLTPIATGHSYAAYPYIPLNISAVGDRITATVDDIEAYSFTDSSIASGGYTGILAIET
jgi:hypothetical protein